jgi:hypothetical protein
VDGVLRVPGVAAERLVAHGEIDLRLIHPEHLGGEQRGRPSRKTEVVMAEDTGVIAEQAEPTAARWCDLALAIEDQK